MVGEILLPVDLNEESSWRKALPSALACCRAFGANLHLMTVVPDFGMTVVGQYFPEGFETQAIAATTKDLHALSRDHVPDSVNVHHVVAYGNIYEEILKAAQMTKAELIVMAARRPELTDYLLGPNAARVVRHASCSVLVVRE